MSTTATNRWPPENIFKVEDATTLRKVRTARGEWLGIYQGLKPGNFAQIDHESLLGPLLCVSQSPTELCRKLACASSTFPVLVRRARSEEELSHAPKLSNDAFLKLRQQAFAAVAEARQIINDPWNHSRCPDEPLTVDSIDEEIRLVHEAQQLNAGKPVNVLSDKQVIARRKTFKALRIKKNEHAKLAFEDRQRKVEIARDFLKHLVNEARSEGGSSGDKATASENRKILDILARLANGKALKEIVIDQYGTQDYDKKDRSLNVQVKRFCNRVGEALCEFCEYRSGTDPARLSDAYVRHVVRDWPGVVFPKDSRAFRHAIDIHFRKRNS
jgi:hypothetical protein